MGYIYRRDGLTPAATRALSRIALCAAASLLLVLYAHARTSISRASLPLTPYERAEHLHAQLEGRPQSQRSHKDYERVLAAYRAVYHGDPASPKADASIAAVAGLLAEEGRLFSQEKSLHDAIGQYEFLRHQYPDSHYRFSALIAEGEIYRRDLGDRDSAKGKYQEFLKTYPENSLANQARLELHEIRQEEVSEKHKGRRAAQQPRLAQARPEQGPAAPGTIGAGQMGASARTPLSVPSPPVSGQQTSQARRSVPATVNASPRPQWRAQEPSPAPPPPNDPTPQFSAPPRSQPVAQALPPPQFEPSISYTQPLHRGRPAMVTGIRQWSTPVYTRIAIDLQDQVQYQAARVPGPDRVYFDLYGARLSPGLIGKSVVVGDDGFLKRIRAAQFSNDVTRIVLDVSSVADYSAFFLPNPWRLIIDIHGRQAGPPPATESAKVTETPKAPAPRQPAPASTNTASTVAPAPSVTASAANSGRVQGRSAGRHATIVEDGPLEPRSNSASAQEIASLGQQPDRVQATSSPTTQPIAASVAGARPAPQPSDGSLASTSTAPTAASGTSRKAGASRRAAAAAAVAAASGTADLESPAMREAAPTAEGERSLVRTLGLKIGRIVVDAGHGGHDSGTLGPGGIEEKDVVLDVALRLGKLLKQRLGADVIYTRDDDTFIPLETRTAIANKAQADLFISIHANSSSDESARGVETYYLNFTTSPDALEVAARENAVSDESIHQLSDLVKKITLKDKIEESREFAADVQHSLYDGLEEGNPGLKDRGVKKAPFVVLIGANMPSILAEISFLTNHDDAHELREPAYRERIAESVYRGIAKYISGLSGIRLAQNSAHTTGD